MTGSSIVVCCLESAALKRFWISMRTGFFGSVARQTGLTAPIRIRMEYLMNTRGCDLDIDKEFWELHPYDELFRKRREYKRQREARMIIPNAPFMRDPVYRPDLYHDNELIVPVPGLKSYSSIIPANMCSTIMFDNFNEDFSRYDICFGDGGGDDGGGRMMDLRIHGKTERRRVMWAEIRN